MHARDEYADIPYMIRSWRTMQPLSTEYRRSYEAIVTRTLPLAEHIARRFGGRGLAHEDLVQVANVGLLNAVIRFDPENGAEFVSFAVPTITGEIRRHFRDCGWALKVPRRLKELHGQLTSARAELSQDLQRAPTPSELAAYLGIEREVVVEGTIASANYSTISADQASGGDDDGMTIQETLGGRDIRYDKILDIETVRPLLQVLPAREREILKLRFFDELTQTQIADRIGCSQMQVSRLLAKTLAALREGATAEVSESPKEPVPLRRPTHRRAA